MERAKARTVDDHDLVHRRTIDPGRRAEAAPREVVREQDLRIYFFFSVDTWLLCPSELRSI